MILTGTTGRTTIVTAAPPTPNGDLHLGHVSGPYLGADVLARARRVLGARAGYVPGSDLNPPYPDTKALELGAEPYQMAERFADDIDRVFGAADMDVGACVRPQHSPRHRELVAEFLCELHRKGALVARERDALFCRACNRYLFEAFVSGDCPVCGADSDGNSCEACAWPNVCTDLGSARCNLCGTPVSTKRTRQLYFPLARYARAWAARLSEIHVSPAVESLRRRVVSDGPAEIPVTHPTDWGLPVPVAGYEDQRVYVWFEMVPGYLADVEEVMRSAGLAGSWRTLWDAPTTDVVQFFGFDNAYFHSVLHPCLLLAYDEAVRLPRALVTNEFLQLDGEKFSTSRNHAIWAADLLEQVGSDATRFALSYLRPEVAPTSFTWDRLVRIVNGELVDVWDRWLEGLAVRVRAVGAVEGAVPGRGRHVAAFLEDLERLTEDVVRAHSWQAFSPQTATRALTEVVRRAQAFREAHSRGEAGVPERGCVTAELAAARHLAALSHPTMPSFSRWLWRALGHDGEPVLLPVTTPIRAPGGVGRYFTPVTDDAGPVVRAGA